MEIHELLMTFHSTPVFPHSYFSCFRFCYPLFIYLKDNNNNNKNRQKHLEAHWLFLLAPSKKTLHILSYFLILVLLVHSHFCHPSPALYIQTKALTFLFISWSSLSLTSSLHMMSITKIEILSLPCLMFLYSLGKSSYL